MKMAITAGNTSATLLALCLAATLTGCGL
ncbi:MAG TPA: type VI secretion system lipoprotein TssJ, partial [Leclercia adecarboxylata]|nr:type VI secretion system lipoprotein TssJ [Leclercia adecarboxylata]